MIRNLSRSIALGLCYAVAVFSILFTIALTSGNIDSFIDAIKR